jgi:hypothetical protein
MATGSRDMRLAIGPANFAGQAYHWAASVEERLSIPVRSFATSDRLLRWPEASRHRFPIHRRLPHHRITSDFGRRRRMDSLLRDVTHLAVDGFLPLYRRLGTSGIGEDLERLYRRDLKIALIAHGSDVRDPDAHMERYEFSYYRSAPEAWVDYLRKYSRRNRALVRETGLPVYVSTPDLLLDLPEATWLPLRIEISDWHAGAAPRWSDPPVVLHLPSRRNPPIKGTEVIDKELQDLASEGRITYLSPPSVPNRLMPAIVRSADIVVDQILGGYYGVAAVEAMAAERLVVGYVSDFVSALLPERPPIVSAPPDCFRSTMERLLSDPAAAREIALSGAAYARRWHDGGESARALSDFLS